MKLKDATNLLKKGTGQHLESIYIPSAHREVIFKPLSTADVKTLTRNNLLDEFDLNVELLKLGLFDKLCGESLAEEGINSSTITQVDYLAFLIGIRQLLNTKLEYQFTCKRCDKDFLHTLELDKIFDELIQGYNKQHETLELIDNNDNVFKFELTNFTMENYLYYRYVITKLSALDEENPDVLHENVYARPILYIDKLYINDEEVTDWANSEFPEKLSFFNAIPPEITIGPAKNTTETLTTFVEKTFIEEKIQKKVEELTVTCPNCGQAYIGLFNFDGFFIF